MKKMFNILCLKNCQIGKKKILITTVKYLILAKIIWFGHLEVGPAKIKCAKLKLGNPGHFQWTGLDRARPDQTRPDWTEPDWTRPDQTGPSWTGPDQTGSDRIRQNSTKTHENR